MKKCFYIIAGIWTAAAQGAPAWEDFVKIHPQIPCPSAVRHVSSQEESAISEALAGNINAQIYLGCAYYFGKNTSIPQSYHKAFTWFVKAAEKNHPLALNNLGFMLKNGYGCTKDYAKAVECFKKAVNTPDYTGIAWFNLAAMYYGGKGAPKDPQLALETFTQGICSSPSVKRLFQVAYMISHNQDIGSFLLHAIGDATEDGETAREQCSSQEAQAAFKVFASILDRGEATENDFLQLLADHWGRINGGIPVQRMVKMWKKMVRILNKPLP